MAKETIAKASLYIGSFAFLVASTMLTFTVIIPFISETLSGERGITAMYILETTGISAIYYSSTIVTLIVMLLLGFASVSLGRYVLDNY